MGRGRERLHRPGQNELLATQQAPGGSRPARAFSYLRPVVLQVPLSGMTLTLTDWIIVIATLGVCFAASLMVARRGGKDTKEYFTSGRAAPWWLIGLSMVATTFSADTPNLVTDIVRRNGVAGNWVWWAFLLTGMATVFIFARLWRRSGVLTDLEFYELRYSGRAAGAVRGFRAVYLGLFFNLVIMASVHLAAVKIARLSSFRTFSQPAM